MPLKSQQVVRGWAVDEIVAGRNKGLVSAVARQFKVSRPTASKWVKNLISHKWLATSGNEKSPEYALGPNRLVQKIYKRKDVDENLIWARDFLPYLTLQDNVRNIVHHGFTEMMNNAHDHSNGNMVTAVALVMNKWLVIVIEDDGIGIFRKITDAMGLPDKRLALLELAKGKFTTDPSRHSGEGIFFTSRIFDTFEIRANGLEYDHHISAEDDVLKELEDEGMGTYSTKGTRVTMSIPLGSTRTTREVFEHFTLGHPEDYSFNMTVVPVKLASLEGENLLSRSQAKRLVARFEGFRKVVLDFKEVEEIGQAFSDEVFRVFANNHPEVLLEVINTSDYVRKMISRSK